MNKVFRVLLLLFVILAPVTGTLISPEQVNAATTTLHCDANGSQQDGTYYGGADYTVMNDANSVASGVYKQATAYKYNSYSVDTCAASGTITNLTIYTYLQVIISGTNYDHIRTYVRISGVNYYGDWHRADIDDGWTEVEDEWALNPATGTAWTNAVINSAEFGVHMETEHGSGYQAYCRTLDVIVTYTPATTPTVDTEAADDIDDDSATLNGDIVDDGEATITNYGFVWDTTSRANPGNTAPGASAYANSWTVGAGTYSEGSIEHGTGETLTEDTTYYFRAAAYNSEGWAYGDEEEFDTVGEPSGNTLAATNVASTTARLNSTLTNDNGQACDVRFGYGETSKTVGQFDTYDTVTSWVEDTYSTGSTPYLDIESLTVSTKYYFRVQIRNDAGTITGAEFDFTTESGVGTPTDSIAIADSDSISVTWVKGTGANYTLVRYSTGSYPAATTEGTLAYSGTGNSVLIEDLDIGTNYYISVWGLTAGVYSSSYDTAMATTLAYQPGGEDLESPPTVSTWTQTPNDAGIQDLPILPDFVDMLSTEYNMSSSWLWYFGWILLTAAAGIVLYNKTESHNLLLSAGLCAFSFGIGAVIGLTMMWFLFAGCVIVAGFAAVGHRY